MYLDFDKAFEWVPLDRTFALRVNGEISNFNLVLSGVPQGSILGPLFLMITLVTNAWI